VVDATDKSNTVLVAR